MVKKIKPKSKTSSKRRVRGKLSKEEGREMKRTCSNLFDWLKPAKQFPMIDEHPSKMLQDQEDDN